MRLDPRQILLPAHMLTVDLAQVGDEEGILVAGIAGVWINGLNAALQSLPNQLFGYASAMMDGCTKSPINRRTVCVRLVVLLGRRDSRRCHALDMRSEGRSCSECCSSGALGVLGRLERLENEARVWARSPRLFPAKEKNHRETAMRQLRGFAVYGSVCVEIEQRTLEVGLRRQRRGVASC
jgi:hypothetical protein